MDSRPRPPVGLSAPADLLTLAVWLAGGLGAAELLALGAVKLLSDRFLWLSEYVIWMVPAGYLLGLAVWAIPVGIARRALPRVVTPFWAVVALALPGFVSILLVYPRLSPWAVGILALGLAVQCGRWLEDRIDRWLPAARARVWWVPAAVALIAAGQLGGTWALERAALARLPAVTGPNILFVILDTVRAANLSVYGYERPTTPRLEALAERGVVFDLPISPSSWTLPSHATAFTGERPRAHEASWRTALPDRYPTLAESLRAAGYATGGFIANRLYCGYETGIDQGFIRYEDYRVSWGEFALSTALGRTLVNHPRFRDAVNFYDIVDRKGAAAVTDAFLDWQRDRERPFFAFLNYLDAHEPYSAPPEFGERFGPVEPRHLSWYRHELRVTFRGGRPNMAEDEKRAELNAYDAAIAWLDHQVGRLLDSLEARGALSNTIVVVTSDHGEHFGEQGQYGHGDGLYLPAVHVPLLMAWGDRIPAGRRVAPAVGLDDLPATLWELSGLAGAAPFPGRSLTGAWREGGEFAARPVRSEFVETAGYPVVTSIVDDRYQYLLTEWPDSVSEELYDLEADPQQQNDLADLPSEEERLARLRALATTP